MTVQRILKVKGTHAPTIAPNKIVADVLESLEALDVGAVVVSSNGKDVEGIISERDIVRGLRTFGPSLLNKRVSDVMTRKVTTCKADDRVAGVMTMMDEQNIRHVPVVKDGQLAGIISIRDIIKLRLSEVQSDADAMRSYIAKGSL